MQAERNTQGAAAVSELMNPLPQISGLKLNKADIKNRDTKRSIRLPDIAATGYQADFIQ